MKIFAVMTALIGLTMISASQTNIPLETPRYKTVTVTNWVRPGPYLRVVNGTTYNIAYSQLWKPFSEWEGLGPFMLNPSDNGEEYHFVGAVHQIKGTTVVYDISEEWMAHETYTGMMYKTRDQYVRSVIVFHQEHPMQAGMSFLCMRIPNYVDTNGIPATAYECGIQATNLVPKVSLQQIKVN